VTNHTFLRGVSTWRSNVGYSCKFLFRWHEPYFKWHQPDLTSSFSSQFDCDACGDCCDEIVVTIVSRLSYRTGNNNVATETEADSSAVIVTVDCICPPSERVLCCQCWCCKLLIVSIPAKKVFFDWAHRPEMVANYCVIAQCSSMWGGWVRIHELRGLNWRLMTKEMLVIDRDRMQSYGVLNLHVVVFNSTY
jgi:hypothetical protein